MKADPKLDVESKQLQESIQAQVKQLEQQAIKTTETVTEMEEQVGKIKLLCLFWEFCSNVFSVVWCDRRK